MTGSCECLVFGLPLFSSAYPFSFPDFDGDGFLGEADLGEAVRNLTHDLLSAEEYATIVSKVMVVKERGHRRDRRLKERWREKGKIN